MRYGLHWSRSRVSAPERAFLARRLLDGSQSVEKASEGSACFVARLTAVVGVGDVEGGFIDGGEEHVRERCCRLFWDRTLRHCGVEHGGDRSESVVGFEASPLVPSEHGGSVDEQDLLNVGVVGGGVEELLECAGQEVERVAALRRACCRGEIGLDLMEDGEEQ